MRRFRLTECVQTQVVVTWVFAVSGEADMTFRDVLLGLAVLLLGLAMVLPVKSTIKLTLAIAGTVFAGVDLLLRLPAV